MKPSVHDPLQIYYNRSFAGGNEGYCLDAIDAIPAGANKSSHLGPIQLYLDRGTFGTSAIDQQWRCDFAKWFNEQYMQKPNQKPLSM